jgi:hypothetical protein
VTNRIQAGMALAAIVAAALIGREITGQAQATNATAPSAPYSVPRTPWGDPDFQGVWTTDHFGQHVDLERPAALAGKVESTEEEAESRKDAEANQNAFGDTVGNYGREWRDTEFSKFKPSRRTSLILEPEDGRVPYTPEARERIAAARKARRPEMEARGPEDLSDGIRCLRGFPGVNLPIGYNNNKQIVQGPGYVAILYEMNHDTRLIPVNNSAPVNPGLRQVWGVPRGHWEGDTLVVETTNFTGEVAFQGARANLKIVERYRRTSQDELDYKFTVEDPSTYTRSWTVWMPWLRDDSQYEIFEYACHEGNYSLANILNAARLTQRSQR